MIKVAVSSRVIAAGIHAGLSGTDRPVVRLTMALMPAPETAGGGRTVSLEDWPLAVEDLLAGRANGKAMSSHAPRPWEFWLSRARAGKARPAPKVDGDLGILGAEACRVDALIADPRDRAMAMAVNALWRWTMSDGAGAPDGLWTSLEAVIAEASSADNRTRTAQIGVAGVGRAEAALCFTVGRAEAAFDAALGTERDMTAMRAIPDPRPAPERRDDAVAMAKWREGSPEVRQALDAARQSSDAVAAWRRSYLDPAQPLAQAVKLLDQFTVRPSSGEADPAGHSSSEILTAQAEVVRLLRGLHYAATAPDVEGPGKTGLPGGVPPSSAAMKAEGLKEQYAARQLLFALRANPTLGRLFRFVIDVEVDAETFLKSVPEADSLRTGEPIFVFLASTFGADHLPRDQVKPVWTITKLGFKNKALAQVWPALREEMELALGKPDGTDLSVHRAVSQSDGLVHLGQAVNGRGPGDTLRRFDLVTVDTAFAIEAEVRRAERAQSAADSANEVAARAAKNQSPEDGTVTIRQSIIDEKATTALVTRGLCIVDRWRHAAVTAEIVNAEGFAMSQDARSHDADPGLVIDAEDLAVGFRVHVGRLTKPAPGRPALAWSGMMNRVVTYEDARTVKPINIEGALARLGLEQGSERRRLSDAASGLSPSRGRQARDPADKPVTWIHVEESLAIWEGDPLALSCRTETIPIRHGADLAISRTYDLPTRAAFPPLRYGQAYRVGVGVVWLGGVSVPDPDAAAGLEAKPGYALPALASPKGQPLRRFLRHEPVLPPVVLLPVGFAERSDMYVRQTGTVAILRKRDGEPDLDCLAWRIILPPRLSIDEIWRHGVLDGEAAAATLPKGAWETIDIDTPWEDFPVFGRRQDPTQPPHLGLASAKPLEELRPGRTPSPAVSGQCALPGKATRSSPPDEQGEPVFRQGNGGKRSSPYYPDPAAEELVIALRPARAPTVPAAVYFAGAPIVVSVSPRTEAFREALPVALAFKRAEGPRGDKGSPLAHQDLAPDPPRIAYADGRNLRDKPFGKAVRVLLVTVLLHEGENVAVDCWFVPRETTLRRWFDLPETALALAQVDDATSDTAVIKALDTAYGGKGTTKSSFARHYGRVAAEPKLGASWTGAAGLPVSARVVAAVGAYLSEAARRSPIPQISGIRTIEAVHAVDRPVRRPAFDGSARNAVLTDSGKVLALTRYRVSGQPAGSGADPREALLGRFEATNPARWQDSIEEGSTGTLLGGSVLVDLDSSATIEILALTVSPQGAPIDDPKRGRTDAQRLAGEWPEAHGRSGSAQAAELFGFHVAPDGRIRHARSQVTLLRIDNLDAWERGSNFVGLEPLDLVATQKAAIARKAAGAGDTARGPRVVADDPFKDTIARRLSLILRATSRHQRLARKVVPDPATGFATDDRPPGFLDSEEREETGRETRQDLWLFATQRPGQPAVHTVMPAFVWTGPCAVRPIGCVEHVREPRIRIWLERPWFSSGEGERLGVVLWPPKLRGLSGTDLDAGKVPRPSSEPSEMNLTDFSDDDLGPGGKFVTRWGADPIRKFPGALGPFMGSSAFKDLAETADDCCEDSPAYVDSVMMPISKDVGLNARTPGGPDRSAVPAATLCVALLTYVPRFDVDSQRWFVDIALNPGIVPGLVEPFVRFGLVRYQPHAISGREVSAPVIAWGQVLPYRSVKVWRSRQADPARAVIKVQVTGPRAARTDDHQTLRLPRLRMALVERRTPSGLTTETQHDWRTARLGPTDPDTADPGEAWCTTLTLDAPKGELHVVVEEDEGFVGTEDRSAAPDTAAAAASLRFSGPRFAAKIRVPS